MSIVIITALIGLALVGLAVMYAIPIRRTWRKEQGKPLATPGPEVEQHEQTAEREPVER